MAARSGADGSGRKNVCCVTTPGRNRKRIWRLWRRCGPLTACPFCLGMLGFDRLVLASVSLPPCRLPASQQAQALGVLAITLIRTTRQVLASTAFAQAESSARSSAMTVCLRMRKAHGSVFSQGTARGERANVLLGR